MADYISKYETGAAVDAALDLAMSALQPEIGKGLSTNDFTNEYKDKVDSNDAEISSARGSYTTVNDRLNAIKSEQESQGAALDEDRAALAAETSAREAADSELYETKASKGDVWGLGTILSANTDLDTITDVGRYFCSGPGIGNTLTNCPTVQPFVITVSAFQAASNLIQRIESINTSTFTVEIYERMKISSGWKQWTKFEGTPVASSTQSTAALMSAKSTIEALEAVS